MRITARTFDDVPYVIDIPSSKAVASGGNSQIILGHIVDRESLPVAVKVFGMMLDDIQQELLLRELKVARQVSRRHPYIQSCIGTADVGPQTAIVSLYMTNGNLLEYLIRYQDVDRKELILQVAEAVNYLHTVEGLVHGDIKCTNVLISNAGDALLADFGLSTFVDKAPSNASTATGIRQVYTVRFAAPELLFDLAGQPERRRSKTRESDVYAFGMLVLEAVTGRSPWFGMSEFAVMVRVCSGYIPSQHTAENELVSISHAWWDICKRCWSYEPGDRPTMNAVLADLRTRILVPCRKVSLTCDSIRASAYMPCGKRLAFITTRGYILIYSIDSGEIIAGSPSSSISPLSCLAVSPNGSQVAVGCSDGTLCLWDAGSCAWLDQPLSSHTRCVTSVAYSPDGTRIVSCSEDCTIRLWDTTGDPIGEPLRGHSGAVRSVSFAPNGTHIVSGADGEPIRLWDVTRSQQIALQVEEAPDADLPPAWFPPSFCITAAAKTVLQALLDTFLEPSTNDVTGISPDYDDAAGWTSVRYTANGEYLVSGSLDQTVRIWSSRTLELKGIMRGHSDCVRVVAVSPSGIHVASCSNDRTVRIWNAETRQPVGPPLLGHADDVTGVEFSPDGKSLVSSSRDRTARIWDLFE